MIRLLITNASSNLVTLFIRMIITFVMSPIIVKALGNYDYGVWEMIISVIGYLGILDLGMTPAIVRYVARYNALNDNNSLNKLYSTSLLFMGLIGLLSLFIFMLWADFKPEILAESGHNATRYTVMLILLGIQLLLKFPGLVAEVFQNGFQRYNLRNNVNLAIGIPFTAITAVLLHNGYGLITLALMTTIETLVKLIIHMTLICFKKYGSFIFNIKYVSWAILKEPLVFGYKSLINYISGMLAISSDSIIIGVLLGPVAVTFYVIPAKLILILSGLLGALTLSFMPFFSDLDARGDKPRAVQTMIVASKFVTGLIVPILISICFLGLPFIKIWMGPAYAENGRWVLYLLAGAYILNYVNPFHNHFLTGLGLHGLLAKLNLAGAILNLILSVIFVKYIGKEGAALGTLIASIVFSPIILSYTCKCMEMSVWNYVSHVILTLVVPNTFLAIVLWFITYSFNINSYFKLMVAAILSISLYCLLFIFISIRKDEKIFILSKIRKPVLAQ